MVSTEHVERHDYQLQIMAKYCHIDIFQWNECSISHKIIMKLQLSGRIKFVLHDRSV